MNYKKLYENIINNRKQTVFNGYTETHHIKPKSLGGTNSKENLVNLSAREHFICHLLLTKMYKEGTIEWIKMCKAFMNMFRHGNHKRYCPSKWYAYCKEQFSQAQSLNQAGRGNSQYGKCWVIHSQTQQIKSINKLHLQEYLQQGWQQGRSLNPKYKNGKYIKLTKEQKALNKQKRKENRKEIIETYRQYYKIYKEYGWEEFKQKTGYPYSKQNLVMAFQRNIPEFKPQNGRKRGKQFETVYYEKVCIICGKTFKTKDEKRKTCCNSCNGKDQSNKIWISNGKDIKHISQEDLGNFINIGWYKIKPVGKHGGCGWDWKRI